MSIQEIGQAVRIVETQPYSTGFMGGVSGIVQPSAGWPIGVSGLASGAVGVTGGEITAHGTITAVVSAGWPLGISGLASGAVGVTGGEITAHGTITAQVGTVTAVVSGGWPIGVSGLASGAVGVTGGEITAHGTVTAQVAGTLTAQVAGGTLSQKMDWVSGFLLSGQNSACRGNIVDMRNYPGPGFLALWSTGCSASARLEASHDSATWFPVTSLGDNGATATAQLSGLYPFVAGYVIAAYDNAWGASAITAQVFMHITKAA